MGNNFLFAIIFGKEYLPSIPALTILGWAYALQIFNAPVSVTLSASRSIKRFIPWAALILGINLTLAVPLILYYSFIGAAMAFLVSKVFETVLRNYLLQTLWGIKRLKIQEIVRMVAPMAVVLMVLQLAYMNSVSHVYLLILAVILYSVCIFFFKGFRQKVITLIGLKSGALSKEDGNR